MLLIIIIAIAAYMIISHKKYQQLNTEVLTSLGLTSWYVMSYNLQTLCWRCNRSKGAKLQL